MLSHSVIIDCANLNNLPRKTPFLVPFPGYKVS